MDTAHSELGVRDSIDHDPSPQRLRARLRAVLEPVLEPLLVKKPYYARIGVEHHWLVDLDARAITAYRLARY